MPFEDIEQLLDLFDEGEIPAPEKTGITDEDGVLDSYFEKHRGNPSFLKAIMKQGKRIHYNPNLKNSCLKLGNRVISLRGPVSEYSPRIESFNNFLELVTYNHPGIAKIKHYMNIAKGNDRLLIAEMDFLKGKTLDKLVREEFHKNYDSVLEILINIASTLEFMHSKGMAHLDISPKNIVWHNKYIHESETREPIKNHSVILDMDSMMKIGESSSSGDYIFTPCYFSPEIIELSHIYSAKDDIINFSIICYELLTGVHPYNELFFDLANVEKENRNRELLRRLQEKRKKYIRGPKVHNEEIPGDLSNAILKGLKFEREERFDSISELKEILIKVYEKTGIHKKENSPMDLKRYANPYSGDAKSA